MATVSRASGLLGSLKGLFGLGPAAEPLDRPTGLPTRRSLLKAIEDGPVPCSLFLLSISNLDDIRSRFGDVALEQAYRFVATRLSIFSRGRLYRIGENRFAALYLRQPLAGAEADMAAAVERLMKLPFRARSVSRPPALSREEALTLRGDAFGGEEMHLNIRFAGVGAETVSAAARLVNRAEDRLKAAEAAPD